MLIELIEDKKCEVKIIKTPSCTILSNCAICNYPIKAGDAHRVLCNLCGQSLTVEQRADHFNRAKSKYPELR